MIRKFDRQYYIKLLLIPLLFLGLSIPNFPTRAQTIDPIYSGYGTATIDGQFGLGEWLNAGVIYFEANTPEGTTPAILYVMNDNNNLYLAVSIERPALDSYTHLRYLFDNDNDNIGEHGDDFLVIYRNSTGSHFSDLFWSNIQNPPSLTFSDTTYGGTNRRSRGIPHRSGKQGCAARPTDAYSQGVG